MADITYFISASYIGAGLENSNFLLFHTQCNNPDYQIEYSGSLVISSASLADGLSLTLSDTINSLYLYPVSEDCPLGCGYDYAISLVLPPSPTPSVSVSPSPTPSVTSTPGSTVTPSPSVSNTPSVSITPSITPTSTPSLSVDASPPPTDSPTPSPSDSPVASTTPTISVTPSISISATPSVSISVSPTPSFSTPPSPTPSITPSFSFAGFECTEWAFSANGGTVIFQYYDCNAQAQSLTLYAGEQDRKCVQDGTTPTWYSPNGGTGVTSNLGNIC